MKRTLLFLIIFLTTTNAQSLYELQLLEKKLSDQNIELQSYEHLEKMFLHKSREVKTLPNPTFSSKIFLLPVETRLGPQRFTADFTQPLPYFGLLQAKADKEKLNAERIQRKQEQKKELLKLALRTYFFSMYESFKLQRLYEEDLKQYQALLRIARDNLEVNKNSMSDVLRLEQLIEETETKIKNLKNEYFASEVKIQDLIEDNSEVLLPDSLPFPDISFEEMPDSTNPFIGDLLVEKKIAEQEMRINSLRNKPQFSVGASYVNIGRYENPALQNVGRDAVALKFAVNLPLYQQKYSAFDDQQMEKIGSINLLTENLLQNFTSDILALQEKYRILKQDYELTEELIRLEETVVRLKYNDFSVGKEDFDDLLEEEIKLLKYQKKLVRLTAKAYVLWAQYNFYLTR